jgi:5-methylcytosine-specific restriction endonuclease McrA
MTPVRLCLQPGCGEHAHYRGRCPIHSKDENRRQHSSPGRIYGLRRWQMLRRRRLSLNPLCVVCGQLATEVDHIQPIEDGGDPWSLDNTQSLCASCHSSKTNAEVRARMRQ